MITTNFATSCELMIINTYLGQENVYVYMDSIVCYSEVTQLYTLWMGPLYCLCFLYKLYYSAYTPLDFEPLMKTRTNFRAHSVGGVVAGNDTLFENVINCPWCIFVHQSHGIQSREF